ncbi:glycosyltransferase family 39 protein [Legionella fallonii]|uniref:glycosyltransferase family 39 protein n=1 Tax=Legionella fallonii TaxID=96230 RepID=UPI000696FE08|nr:glycosyltransferase family 39 protein [Legionella fallonii]
MLPIIFQPNTPLDVCEGFVWGNEWPIGTYKHPPLQAWLLQITYYLFGSSPIGFYGLSALSSGITLWVIYRTGVLLVSPLHGLLAAALAQNIVYFNFLSTEFNPNVLQMLWGAITSYLFAIALLRQHLIYWILLGISFSAGFYSKYSTLIQAIAFLLFLIVQSKARKNLMKSGPYLTLFICVMLYIPHIFWLIQNHFLPQKYIKERLGAVLTFKESLYYLLRFWGVQLLDSFFALLSACLLLYPFQRTRCHSQLDEFYKKTIVQWLAYGPIILLSIFSLASAHKLNDMYGMPYLTFIPLALLSYFKLRAHRVKIFVFVWMAIFIFQIAFYIGLDLLNSKYNNFGPHRTDFPGPELAKKIDAFWHSKTKAPLQYIIGNTWIAGNAAFYSMESKRPHVWINGRKEESLWINPLEVKKYGAMLIWIQDDRNVYAIPKTLANKFPEAQLGDKLTLSWRKHSRKLISIGVAYLPPAS